MSALQKYKAKTKELAEENERLQEEVKRLKAGRPLREDIPAGVDPEALGAKSAEIIKEIHHLVRAGGPGWPLAASKVEYALLDAFNQGKASALEKQAKTDQDVSNLLTNS